MSTLPKYVQFLHQFFGKSINDFEMNSHIKINKQNEITVIIVTI